MKHIKTEGTYSQLDRIERKTNGIVIKRDRKNIYTVRAEQDRHVLKLPIQSTRNESLIWLNNLLITHVDNKCG